MPLSGVSLLLYLVAALSLVCNSFLYDPWTVENYNNNQTKTKISLEIYVFNLINPLLIYVI